jgi:ABC-type transport system involved in cytochrome bd biosynthesis fused ATPase/permease subunit
MIPDGLPSLREGRMSFVIAHRLSTIRSADQILVLEGAEIVERGTHAQLLALNGRYRQLHRLPERWRHHIDLGDVRARSCRIRQGSCGLRVMEV